MINSQSIVVRKGEETVAGKVTKIEEDAGLISGTPERRLQY